ncbi:MAG: hypothetical protein C0613_10570 [Desulfobulbaceae bacterium]|nr:MAG: hypothetical protein C0613_10570 [Desulfobulbaceae bacterium]
MLVAVWVPIDVYYFLLAQKVVQKGPPSSPGLTARSFSFVKGEFQKLTPCGCSDMLKFKSLPQKKTSSGLDGDL